MNSEKKLGAKFGYWFSMILIPTILLAIVFKIMNVAPFGANNFLVSDLQAQYMPFFTELRRSLLSHHFSSYSFLNSIGDNLVPVYTYYLMSPLNLIVVFFKVGQLPIAIDLIIWLKIILCSISMEWFLTIKYKRYDVMSIAGGLAYGLCGFVAMYYYDLMWLDALIVLPIVVWGLENLFNKNKVWLYVFSLAYLIYTNYYMGYMICLFCVIYFVYLMKKNQPEGVKFSTVIREKCVTIWHFIWYSGIAALLTGVLLVPTAISMLATGKGDFSIQSFMPLPTFSPSFTVNLGIGANNFLGRLNHEPSLFTGSLFIIGFIAYLISKQIHRGDKRASIWLTSLIFAGMFIMPLNTIWHLFQQPAGFPFRMVYLFSFAIIMITYEGYLEGLFKDTKALILAASITAALIAIGYLAANFMPKNLRFDRQLFVNNIYLIYIAIFIVVTTALMIMVGKNFKLMSGLLLIVLAVELGTNFVLSSDKISLVNQANFEKHFDKANQLEMTQKAKFDKEANFYRANVINEEFKESYEVPYNGYNDSMIFGVRGVGSYSSTLNANTQYVLSNLGFGSRNIRRISMIGAMPITENLFGIRYKAFLLDGQNKVTSNDFTAGLGIMTDNQIQNLKLKSGKVFENLNNLANAQMGTNHQFFIKPSVETYSVAHGNKVESNITVKAQVSGPQYLYIPYVQLNEMKIEINDQPVSPIYEGLFTNLIPLGGNSKKGQTIKVKITAPYEFKDLKNYFAGFDYREYKNYIKDTKQHHFKLTHPHMLDVTGSHFNGSVNVKAGQNTLVMSMPYDKGWQVKVDGDSAKVIKVADGLMGVELTKGHHILEFNYQVRGLLVGAALTTIGIILVFASIIVRMRKRH